MFIRKEDRRDESVTNSIYWSCRGPEFTPNYKSNSRDSGTIVWPLQTPLLMCTHTPPIYIQIWLKIYLFSFIDSLYIFTSCILFPLISLSPCIGLLPLQPPLPPIKTKFKWKTKNQTKQRNKTKIRTNWQTPTKNLVVEIVVWSVETHSFPFIPFIFSWKCSLPRVVGVTGLAQDLWFLQHHW